MKRGLYNAATGLMAVIALVILALGSDAFAYQLKGTIYGGSNPLPNAKVDLINAATFANLSSTTSNSSGGYGFSTGNGTYNLNVSPPSASGFSQSIVNGIAVSGADVTQNVVLMQQAITVSGTVKSSDGTVVQGATVYFRYAGTSTVAKQIVTDASGAYSSSLSPGSYDIQVSASRGSVNHVASSVSYYFYNQSFSATTTKDLLLPTVKVTGKTTDSNGIAVAGVTLRAEYTSGSGFYLNYETATSDANGSYTLYLPPYNNYLITSTPPTGNTVLAPTNFTGQNFSSDTVKDFALRSAITVSGTVTSSDGTTVQNATIYFRYAGTSTVAKSVSSGTTGTYTVLLSPGSYDIQISASKGSVNHIASNVSYYLYSQSFSATTTKDFLLSTVKVTGKTTDSNGVAVAGVTLRAEYTSSADFYLNYETATSDANGSYTLYLPPYSNYLITATPPTGNTVLAPTNFTGQNFTSDTVKDFALSSAVTVSGTVTSSDGTAVQNATIYFRYAGTSTTAKSVSSGTDGLYTALVAPGAYDIQVSASKGSVNHVASSVSYYLYNQSFSANTTKDLNLSTVKITGKTTDSNGVPIAGVSVRAEYISGSGFYLNYESATSDASGTYILYLPPYNGYSINITPPTGSGFSSQMLRSLNYSTDLLQNIILDLPDTKPPVIVSGPAVSAITNTSAVVEWQTSEPTTAALKYGIANPPATGVAIATARANHSQTLSGLSADTTYYVSVAATDVSGNGPVASPVASFRTKQLADTTPPTILEGPIVTSITQGSAVVGWLTDEPSTGTLYYGLTSNPGTTKSDATQATGHRLSLTGLAADTLYYVKVAAKDLKGNGPTTSAVVSFKTLAAADTTAPLIVEGPMAINISDTEATILWKTDEPATSGVSYNDGVAYGVTADAGLVTEHSVRLTGLKPSALHTYTVSSKDALGNGPVLSQPATFKTLATPDTTPPVIIERSVVVYTTHQSAVIFWRTDEPADSLVEFGKADTLGSSEGKAALVTHHTITLTGLEQGTLYYFRVSSKDAAGNGPTVSTILTFTTDTLPKAKSLVITKGPDVVDLSYNQATISWETDIPADSAIDYSTAGVPGTMRVSDAKREKLHQLTVTNLAQNSPYTATVISSSVDGATAKAPVSFSTLNPPDTDAPQIIDGPTAIGITDSKASIKWRTDRAADSRVYFGIQGQPMDNFEGETKFLKEHVVVLTNLQPATTYAYYVVSYDPKGNGPATSSVWTFTTKGTADTTGPTMTTPTVSGITESQAVISWTTGEPATTQVAFGLAADLLNSQSATPGLRETHDITLTNLAAETTYYVKAISADTTGNQSESTVVSFTTMAAPRYWKVTPAAPAYGTISPSSVQTVLEGTTTSFTLTPSTGYMIASASGCGGTLSGDTFTTGPVTADCTVTALFVSDKPAVTLAASLPSPQQVGSSVTFTATGSGGRGSYEYAFQVMEGGVWKTAQDYSSLNTWVWDTTGKAAAAYNLKVLIRNAGSTAASEGFASLVYSLSALPKPTVTLSASLASPQVVGTQVTFTAAGSGGTGSYEYAFQLIEGGVWKTKQAYSNTATWTWDTTGSPITTYSLKVLIRNSGSTADSEGSASLGYILSAPPKPTVQLTANPASPQVVGAQVTFTATGSGGTGGYEYQFRILDGGVWSIAQTYGTPSTFVLDTTGKNVGTYRVEVQIRNANSTADVEGSSYLDYSITLPPKPTVSVTANPAGPQPTGTSITFTATGSSGTGSYEYAFQMLNNGVWETVQAYGTANTWAWDTTGKAAATYSVKALIRTPGSTVDEDSALISYTLAALPKPTVKLSGDKASPQVVGSQITFTAVGSAGTGSYEYAFQIMEGGAWNTKQPYSSTATWTWDTTGITLTTYTIRVLIRNAGSTADLEASAALSYVITAPPKPTVQLDPTPASPQVAGTPVTFTATGNGGSGSYEYSFQVLEGGVWKTMQAYSGTNTWTWDTTGKVATTYSVKVLIRNAGSSAASEGTALLNYVLTAPPKPTVQLAAVPASPQIAGTQITFTATGSGGSGSYEYEFRIYEGGAWKTMQTYSGANTWTWDTTGKIATTYQVGVLIRNAGSTAASEGSVTLNYALTTPPTPKVTLAASVPSPQLVGTQITFTATGSGGTGNYEYSFQVYDGVWTTVQPYSGANTWTWDTTGKKYMGYTVKVLIRNVGSTAASQSSAQMSYVLTSPPKPTVTLAVAPTSPQRVGTQITFTATGSGGTGSYEYAFEMMEAGVWTRKQDFSANNAWTWDTAGLAPNTYSIRAVIRNAGSAATLEGSASKLFTLSP
ncbi:carboxypeptidase regulatory-like domain-containing protein [Geobacter hydrogenophilus]|uniref:Fibronectin type-III domain-containing protein n=1 Tax=Geobacter hydrogenophilus TaxID=40983 RepID=A0A9W6G0Z1_9BACT|nr:carboxypeptidase regulatory-like domain-containing protein [Geobacter hydrogenophilus]MBT0894228.1 carboxypeptidase regulatory-like domain-containing protein [Geobacter hydrogenophilus]GLI38486.1 hypothetical protein GHYDROH2_19870 [Geobacter hydrogenophilus]